MRDALINLRVPQSVKGRWVRASRTCGMRLTDWIIEAVENQLRQQIIGVVIPDGITFADLRLQREPDGSLSFDWPVIEQICQSNKIPVEVFAQGPEENLSRLFVIWYHTHIQNGGDPDPVTEDLLREVETEDQAGQPFSYPPGIA